MSASFRHILLIKPGSFGDVIHALPCAAAIKAHYPDTRLTWLVDDRWQDILTGNPAIDQTVIFPRRQFRGLGGALRSVPWAFGLRDLQPDVVLDLQGLIRSALMGRLSGAPRLIGLADAREGSRHFYHDVTPVHSGEHSVRRYLRSLDFLDIPPVTKPEFHLPAGQRPVGEIPADFILLHPFARGGGKSLTPEQVNTFARAVAPLPVVLAGMGETPAGLPGNVHNFLNTTSIPEMIWLLRAASFVVSVDSGPMHIAAAVTDRLLAIHTWSDPRLVGPYNENAWLWQGGELRRQNLTAPSLPEGRTPNEADIADMAGLVRQEL